MARERSDKSKNKSPKKEERRVGKSEEGMPTSSEPAERASSGDSIHQQDSLQSTRRSKKRQEHQRIEEETAADLRESESSSEQMHPTTTSTTDGQHIEDDSVHRRIAERAFSLFQERGYEHGNDWAHWFEAERQIKNTQV